MSALQYMGKQSLSEELRWSSLLLSPQSLHESPKNNEQSENEQVLYSLRHQGVWQYRQINRVCFSLSRKKKKMRTELLGQGLSFLHQPLHFLSLSAFSPSQILLYHLCCSCSIFSLIPRVYPCLTYTVLNVIYPHLRDFRLLVHKFLEKHCETKGSSSSDLLLKETLFSSHIVLQWAFPLFKENHSSDTQWKDQR